ncbi:MAG: YeeE/YedE thiosulfate transporter family protein, partial [Pseudomonadota bacterium]
MQVTVATLVLGAGALGIGLGVLLERYHLCTMGAVADVVLFGSWRRARMFGTALAMAALLLHAGVLIGAVVPAALVWPIGALVAASAGGVLFGLGMVLAGGCASRLVVRAASGNGKATVALLALLASAGLTIVLLPLPVTGGFVPTGHAVSTIAILVAFAVLIALIARARTDDRARGLWPALGLGAIVAGAMSLTAGSGNAVPPNFVPAAHLAGDADARMWGFLVALLVGTLAGSAVSARQGGRWRPEGLAPDDDFRRHLGGGVA